MGSVPSSHHHDAPLRLSKVSPTKGPETGAPALPGIKTSDSNSGNPIREPNFEAQLGPVPVLAPGAEGLLPRPHPIPSSFPAPEKAQAGQSQSPCKTPDFRKHPQRCHLRKQDPRLQPPQLQGLGRRLPPCDSRRFSCTPRLCVFMYVCLEEFLCLFFKTYTSDLVLNKAAKNLALPQT